MDNLNRLLKELKTLVGGTDEANRRRFTEILNELETHKNEPEVQEALDAFIMSGIKEIKQDITTLRQHGKSASWLYQRINGNKVGGRSYTLNEEQKATFNRALQDIAKRISSFSIV